MGLVEVEKKQNGGFAIVAMDCLLTYKAEEVKGATLEKTVEKSTEDDLRRWIECRGLSCPKSEKHSVLVRR